MSASHSAANRAAEPPTAIITGASSGVGLHATKALVDRGWRVVMACRDIHKARRAAEGLSLPPAQTPVFAIDLGDLASVRAFAAGFLNSGLPLDALVCNAAVYRPRLPAPVRSPQGFEISVATNYFGHFLLIALLLGRLAESPNGPRLVTLGTVTANSEELAGRIPIPAPADLGDLAGLEAGFRDPVSMIDGKSFRPGKAYKDSKLCTMILSRELHRRFHEPLGVVFSTLYPGCVADTALFRETPALFRAIFPWFQKTITKGYVTQALAGERTAQVVADQGFEASGVHWSWGGQQRDGREAFHQPLSAQAQDQARGERLFALTAELTGATGAFPSGTT